MARLLVLLVEPNSQNVLSSLIFFQPLSKRDKLIAQAKTTMSRIGLELVRDCKSSVSANKIGKTPSNTQARDLLSLLIHANMSIDLSETQQLSDEDVVARMNFLREYSKP